ncbi:hypothetical protein TM1040_1647 [Ruegeria sp. TM1040]|nr:hypothetical protein TM1040_1647 [Ruegeria sp. TM1040]
MGLWHAGIAAAARHIELVPDDAAPDLAPQLPPGRFNRFILDVIRFHWVGPASATDFMIGLSGDMAGLERFDMLVKRADVVDRHSALSHAVGSPHEVPHAFVSDRQVVRPIDRPGCAFHEPNFLAPMFLPALHGRLGFDGIVGGTAHHAAAFI